MDLERDSLNMSVWNPQDFRIARQRMVDLLRSRGLNDDRVLEVMGRTPRHLFVDEALANKAYGDYPLPIGDGQTISQPFIVGLMTQHLSLQGRERVLEIGCGCGYQTAILAQLSGQVFALERLPGLLKKATDILGRLEMKNVSLKLADGTLGWPEMGPYSAILVAAGGPQVPQPLVDQLAPGGRLIVPVGPANEQKLLKVTKSRDGRLERHSLGECRFVGLIGRHGW